MNIGEAMEAIRDGELLTRNSWNNDDINIRYVAGYEGEGGTVFLPHIILGTASKAEVPWSALYDDLFANDWRVI